MARCASLAASHARLERSVDEAGGVPLEESDGAGGEWEGLHEDLEKGKEWVMSLVEDLCEAFGVSSSFHFRRDYSVFIHTIRIYINTSDILST